MPKVQASVRRDHRGRLRGAGLRHTVPRERILAYLDRKNVHPTPEELYRGLRKKGYDIGLSTVYLNLQVLKQAGLVWDFKDPLGMTRYDGYTRPHHHLICLACGRVEDILTDKLPELASEALAERLPAPEGWRVVGARVLFTGYCPRCSSGKKGASKPREKTPAR